MQRSGVRPSACLSRRSTSAACRSRDAGSRYQSIAAGAQAASAGSVMSRAEVRGSAETCCVRLVLLRTVSERTEAIVELVDRRVSG